MRFCGDRGRLAGVRGCCGSCSSQGISVAPKPGVQGARARACSPIWMNGADKMRVASSVERDSSKDMSGNMRHSLAEALPQCSVTLHHVAHCDGSSRG